MTGTEICPKCGTHFDGVWWQNAETENERLREQLAAAKAEDTRLADQVVLLNDKLDAAVEVLKACSDYIWDSGYFDDKSPLICKINAVFAKLGEEKPSS